MDIRSKEFAEIVRNIARRYNLEYKVVHNVIISQFDCIRAKMAEASVEEDYFPYIKLPYLMTIKALPRKRKHFVEKAKQKRENVHNGEGQAGDRAESPNDTRV